MQMVLSEYGAASAQAAADFYDAVRTASVGEQMGAVAHSGLDPKATDGTVRAFVKDAVEGKYGMFNASASTESTTSSNARRRTQPSTTAGATSVSEVRPRAIRLRDVPFLHHARIARSRLHIA